MIDKRYENHYNMNNNNYQYTIKYIFIKPLTKKYDHISQKHPRLQSDHFIDKIDIN